MRLTAVSKCLDRKLTLLGYEVLDLIAIFMTLSILNLAFGQTSLKWLFVWIPTITLAVVLRYCKRGKPEKYLVHWLRFQFKPGVYSAFPESTQMAPPRLKERK